MALLRSYRHTIYHLKADFYGLSKDIKCIQVNRLMPIVSDSKFEKSFFFLYFLNTDFSFNIL